MSSRTEKDKTKQLQDKCQVVLTELLRDEDNKYCVDCDSKGTFITYCCCEYRYSFLFSTLFQDLIIHVSLKSQR